MDQLLAACSECESLLCAYGQARFQCEERKKSVLVEGRDSEASQRSGKFYHDTWEECLQLRQEILSHLLLHDTM